jgi:hypothetical protein
VVITTNGRPAAVLVSYEDFLALLRGDALAMPEEVIDLEEWERGRQDRRRVRDSVLDRFQLRTLPRKGQKRYKRETVRGLGR